MSTTPVMQKGILEMLDKSHQDAEIWWDSSPLIFKQWSKKILDNTPEERKISCKERLAAFFDKNNPEKSLIKGVTTNPTLVYQLLTQQSDYWRAYIRQLADYQHLKEDEIFYAVYKEVGRRSAEFMFEQWEKTNGKYGWVSLQMLPELVFRADAMLRDALNFAKIAPNIMIKVPATAEGFELLEEMTARGISTNMTLSFNAPQFHHYLNAVENGLATAKANKIDLSKWRSVYTYMAARFGTKGDMLKEAKSLDIQLSEMDLRWAEILMLKKLQSILNERNVPVKLLLCSLRTDKPNNGHSQLSLHIEKTCGFPLVFTCPPAYIEELMTTEHDFEVLAETHILTEKYLEKLLQTCLQIPYFARSYQTDGMTLSEINQFSALQNSLQDVRQSSEEMKQFIAETLSTVNI